MAKKLKRAGITIALLIAVEPCWWVSASVRGKAAASYDVRRGRYKQLGTGEIEPWIPDYTRILRERYKVEHVRVAGCLVSDVEVRYINGYNSVSTAAANRGFGKDIFTEAWREATEAEKATGR